jgi:hypothetical protein
MCEVVEVVCGSAALVGLGGSVLGKWWRTAVR